MKTKREVLFYAIVYILLFVVLLPYLRVGIVGDDILNSLIYADSINRDYSIYQDMLFHITKLLKEGRITVVFSLLTYITFCIFQNTIAYKLWIILLSVGSLYVGSKFIEFHFQSSRAARMFCIFSICVIPLYFSGSNSYMMYIGFMQYEVMMFFGTILFF